jgi:hypothetical protein
MLGLIGQGAFSVSNSGVLADRRSTPILGQFSGSIEPAPLRVVGTSAERLLHAALSPDERRVAVAIMVDANTDTHSTYSKPSWATAHSRQWADITRHERGCQPASAPGTTPMPRDAA